MQMNRMRVAMPVGIVAVRMGEDGTTCLDTLDPSAVALEDRTQDPPLRIGRDPSDLSRSDSAHPLHPDTLYHLVLPLGSFKGGVDTFAHRKEEPIGILDGV